MTPKSPLLVAMAPHGCPPNREVCKPFCFPLGSRHSLGRLQLTRFFHFFPTPLVTFDLECRFLLLEEWLSLLPGCLGGLSSEPGQRNENTPSPGVWGLRARSADRQPLPLRPPSSADTRAPPSGLMDTRRQGPDTPAGGSLCKQGEGPTELGAGGGE